MYAAIPIVWFTNLDINNRDNDKTTSNTEILGESYAGNYSQTFKKE